MVEILLEALRFTVAAILLPLGLILSLLGARTFIWVWRFFQRRGSMPLIVQPLNFEHQIREFVSGQTNTLLELPSRLRDYIADDPGALISLAPGLVTPVAPQLSAATPDQAGPVPAAAQIFNTLFPKSRPGYNIVLVPEVPREGLAVGVQIVKLPEDILLSARSFYASDINDLVFRIGGYCSEIVLEQPPFLRQAPRWEHWNRGAYESFRRGLRSQRLGQYDEAHKEYTHAAHLSPGNARIALYHGSLHETQEEFEEAARTYDAAGCLWRQNIDLTFRSAAARVNLALTATGSKTRDERIRLIKDANNSLAGARRRVSTSFVWRRVLRSIRPRRRDVGERRYWRAWLRPDSYRRALRLLRRSKGHEYRCALDVAYEANRVSLWVLGENEEGCKSAFTSSWRFVTSLVSQRRSGWLAHWSAACFFSRAMEIPVECRPGQQEWAADWERIETGMRARGLPLGSDHSAIDWTTYCKERAVGEISRVIRNPCNQLDRRLLTTDPDMIRLRYASENDAFLVLLGLANYSGKTSPDVPAQRQTQGRINSWPAESTAIEVSTEAAEERESGQESTSD